MRVFNSGVTTRKIRFEWVALLIGDGENDAPMAPAMIQSANILQGQVANLAPVVFLSGGAEARHSPYPSLHLEVELLPGLDTEIVWGHAACSDPEEFFQLARGIGTRNWTAEIARIEMTNAGQLEIETGNPDWDLVFKTGQNTAYSLLHSQTAQLPYPTFVSSRLPDRGYSFRADGTDYDPRWSGATVFEAWHLSSLLLPASPKIAQGFLENFLSSQDEDGKIDLVASPSGRRTGILATPMLCTLAWKIYTVTEDHVFLVKNFPRLHKFLQNWFKPEHDRDEDGVPEWDHPLQSGFEDNPVYAHWEDDAQGVEISRFETPSLNAFLIQECEAILKISEKIGYPATKPYYERKIKTLTKAIHQSWDPRSFIFRYRDRETHQSSRGLRIALRTGPGLVNLNENQFDPAARLAIRISRQEEGERSPAITILGTNKSDTPIQETIEASDLRWTLGWGTGVSENVYTHVNFVQVDGILENDEVRVNSVDYRHQDMTLLSPLWTQAPNREEVDGLVRHTLTEPDKFWGKYGIAALRMPTQTDVDSPTTWIPWSNIIGAGLIAYGYRDTAADLLSNMMDAVILNLKKGGTFRRVYDSQTGQGIGERNSVIGLPPLELFLRVLGVQPRSNWKVALEGTNPFPWPVTIRFRGLTIERLLDETVITFPNGKTVAISDPTPCVVVAKPDPKITG